MRAYDDELRTDVTWEGLDPRNWRDMEEADDLDDDEDVPASQDVIDTLGFDPRELFD